MKKSAWKLLLAGLAPAAVGWVYNVTFMIWATIPVLGMFIWYGVPLAVLAFWGLLGYNCRAKGRRYLPTLALTHWVMATEVAVYLWQFLLVGDEARSMLLAGFSQWFNVFAIYTTRLALLFESQPNYVGQATMTASEVIALALIVLAFSLGWLWPHRKPMKVIGITGPTGAGKTTALNALRELGAEIIDADAVYHDLLESSDLLRRDLVRAFGDGILDGAGQVDRKALAAAVYPDGLERLNEITHPYVMTAIDYRVAAARRAGRPAAAIDAIALIESGAAAKCDTVVAVLAPLELRVKRIMARDGIDEAYARRRALAQPDDGFFRSHSGHVLENTQEDTPEEFGKRARALFEELLR
ncbi:hypothetical protein CE91St43_22070 [Oscillospiraceae bacterium]|nr:hypothetical protein CE91St43_22070 [Oscillospiraceae bacterium]